MPAETAPTPSAPLRVAREQHWVKVNDAHHVIEVKAYAESEHVLVHDHKQKTDRLINKRHFGVLYLLLHDVPDTPERIEAGQFWAAAWDPWYIIEVKADAERNYVLVYSHRQKCDRRIPRDAFGDSYLPAPSPIWGV